MAEDGIREERYDLAIIRLGDLEIPCNDFKVSYKIKADRKYATNSYSPYGVGFSEEEISWEASEIDDKFSDIIKRRTQKQKVHEREDYISTYNLDDNGDPICKAAWIESWDDEKGGDKFGAKGGALSIKFED